MKTILPGILGLLLSGCLYIPTNFEDSGRGYQVDKSFQYEKHPDVGVVIGSVTIEGIPEVVKYIFCNSNNRRVGFVDAWHDTADEGIHFGNIHRIKMIDQTPEIYGQFFALKLPPGKYYFNRKSITDFSDDINPPLMFQVERGKMIYIGNIHTKPDRIQGLVAFKYESINNTVLDAEQRDTKLVKKFLPALRSMPYKKKLIVPVEKPVGYDCY